MKIVGIAACTAGIAHTYIAKEKLLQAAESLGHEIWIETQGLAGTQDLLSQTCIADADVVLIAADIKVNGKERFLEKKIVEVPTSLVVKSPRKLIEKLEEMLDGRTKGV
ncbi:TPA: PTS fructose transporter subunit IIB [Enterococcus faecium]